MYIISYVYASNVLIRRKEILEDAEQSILVQKQNQASFCRDFLQSDDTVIFLFHLRGSY